MRIHNTLFVSFDPLSSELSARAKEYVLFRLGKEYEACMQTASADSVNSALDRMTALDSMQDTKQERGIVDHFFLLNLIFSEADDSLAVPFKDQLKSAEECYSLILNKSLVQGFNFNIFAIFLLPSLQDLNKQKGEDLLINLTSLRDMESLIFHHALLFSPDNPYVHLNWEQQKEQVVSFIGTLVFSPLRRRIINYLNDVRSIVGGNELSYFSAGATLIDASTNAHRRYNFLRSKDLFLKRINKSSFNFDRAQNLAEHFVNEFFRRPDRHRPVIADIAEKLRPKKAPDDVFGNSLFHMMYEYMEYIDDEKIYSDFDEYLKRSIFGSIKNSHINTRFVKLWLKETLNNIEEIYSEVELPLRTKRMSELKGQHNRYLMTPFIKKLGQWFSSISLFSKTQDPFVNLNSNERPGMFNFIRLKALKDFFEHIRNSIRDYTLKIDHDISQIRSDEIEFDSLIENRDSPFVLRIFRQSSHNSSFPLAYARIFDSRMQDFERIVEEFIRDACNSVSFPPAPDDTMKWLYNRFKEFYSTVMEKRVYQIESEILVDSYGKDIEHERDLKEEILTFSTPYISFFREWSHRPYLFYSTQPEELDRPFDDYEDFIKEHFAAKAFAEIVPWEIQIVQIEGPFRISDTLLYRVLKDENNDISLK